jgi:tetratricopeptide (TPR) repeat protein
LDIVSRKANLSVIGMTGNHLLLYRLAELMLEHEQHILPVDLLFDDEQIGDFVKSIQIDSPYQQMLLEGVLTESVKDEKLFVSFTVEGYFHYVLGEVIHNRTEGSDAESLKQIVEENNLNGAKEGVEQCLIRDMHKSAWDRTLNLIAFGSEIVNWCIVPFTKALLIAKSKTRTKRANERALFNHVELMLSMLFKRQTPQLIKLLEESIKQLQSLSKFKIVECVYKAAQNLIELEDIESAGFLLKSISFLQRNNSKVSLKEIETFFIINQNSKRENSLGYLQLADFYRNKLNYRKALKYYNICKNLNIPAEVGYIDEGISIISLNKELFDEAIFYAEFALSSRISKFGFFSVQVADSFFLLGRIWDSFGYENNLSNGEGSDECFQKAIDFYIKCLDIRKVLQGAYHEDIAAVYQTIGNTLKCGRKYFDASNYFHLALKIQTVIRGENAFIIADIKSDIADIYLNIDRKNDALALLQESYNIFKKLGKNSVFAQSVLEMLEKAKNDL